MIDENKSNIESISKLLDPGKFECDKCYDAISGLRKIKSDKYDLIITDMEFPLITGLEILRVSKKLKSDTPVMIYGCKEDEKITEECEKHGADVVINKSQSHEEIADYIKRL